MKARLRGEEDGLVRIAFAFFRRRRGRRILQALVALGFVIAMVYYNLVRIENVLFPLKPSSSSWPSPQTYWRYGNDDEEIVENPQQVKESRSYARRFVNNTRNEEEWDCATASVDVKEMFHDHPITRPIQQLMDRADVTLLRCLELGHSPGGTCNRYEIIAGAMYKMQELNLQNSILALNPYFSAPAWALDLEALSRPVLGVLLDCRLCTETETLKNVQRGWLSDDMKCADFAWIFYPPFLTCSSLIVQGRVFNVLGRIFRYEKYIETTELWDSYRPRTLGINPFLSLAIQPPVQIRRIVGQLVDNFRDGLAEDVRTLGLHRRFMDGFCYHWITAPHVHQCAPDSKIPEIGFSLRYVLNDLPNWYGNMRDPDFAWKITNERRERNERENNLVTICNFTLSNNQVQVFRKTWSIFKRYPLAVLVSSDKQDPAGDRQLLSSRFPVKIGMLTDMERPGCFANRKHYNMLAEMVSLTIADLNMENTMSTCGSIVTHWRSQIFKKRPGTSFPPECYDGLYSS